MVVTSISWQRPTNQSLPLEVSSAAERFGSSARVPRRLEPFVYARHGHELMGCKSPVGVPVMSTMWTNITTSRRQGQTREGMSEGSPSAKVRADEQKLHRRPGPRVSQHNMTKPIGYTVQGKCGGCAPKVHVLIRGELSDMRLGVAMGAGLRPSVKALESPPDPTTTFGSAFGGNP